MEEIPYKKRKRKPFFVLLMLVMTAPLLMGALCSLGTSTPILTASETATVTAQTNTNHFSQIKMIDANNGWATTTQAVFRTTDGGKTWNDLTPLDWEPEAASSGTASGNASISGIVAASFLDADHAWIVAPTQVSSQDASAESTAVSGATSYNNGTMTVDTTKLSPIGTSVYIRSTIDGGRTWMTSNALAAQNLSGVSQPDFINTHEGWLELMLTQTTDSSYVGDVYHSVDGGVTWQQETAVLPAPAGGGSFCQGCFSLNRLVSSVGSVLTNHVQISAGAMADQIASKNQLVGMTIMPDCVQGSSSGGLPQCAASAVSTVQGCTVAGTTAYVGLATANATRSSLPSLLGSRLWLSQELNGNAAWENTYFIPAPGGVPGQSDNSIVVTLPPIAFPDGTGILPVQLQGDPQDKNASFSYLHLYGVRISSGLSNYQIGDLSPNSPFVVSLLNGSHIISAPDMQHVFVVGQEQNNGDAGNWNLYELSGKNWVTLTSQADASIPVTSAGNQSTFLNEALSNLDFVSDTEGWVTNGTDLYHITIANNIATWTHIYPAPQTSTTTNGGGSTVTVPRSPGTLAPSPTNPPACDGGNGGPNGPNGPVNPGNMPLSVFNALPTDMHTWYSAPNNDPPGYDSYPHAKGDGSYAHPITFAIADSSQTFRQGEIIYIPELEKYFFAEDTCAACQAELQQGHQDHIDLWVGDLSSDCATNIHVPPTIYSSDLDPEPIHYLAVSANNVADQSYTVDTTAFSCG